MLVRFGWVWCWCDLGGFGVALVLVFIVLFSVVWEISGLLCFVLLGVLIVLVSDFLAPV